jgi:cytochrome c oxidase assembly protein Cox11
VTTITLSYTFFEVAGRVFDQAATPPTEPRL